MLEIERLLCWMVVVAAANRGVGAPSVAHAKLVLRAHGDWTQRFLPDEYKQVHS